MVALALISAAYILQADFNRRGMKADAFYMVTISGLSGIVGSKLYLMIDDPPAFFADPWAILLNRYGFVWFGGFLGGIAALLLLGRRAKLPLLKFLDACSPAASFGYGIGRIGCFLSGDGDYGKPTSLPWGMSFPNGVVPTLERVHPTPIYEFLAWCAIGAFLWHMGTKVLNGAKSKGSSGEIFGTYLILTGIARFLVEIIRINPPWILGMTNAQVVSLACILAGAAVLWRIKGQFHALKK
jgi:phosphatidylglycerol:prolipoprotein diacylglycerol transferase